MFSSSKDSPDSMLLKFFRMKYKTLIYSVCSRLMGLAAFYGYYITKFSKIFFKFFNTEKHHKLPPQ